MTELDADSPADAAPPDVGAALDLDFTKTPPLRDLVTQGDPVTVSRPSAATRVNEQGFIEPVAADTARQDFDPLTRACKGLLVEDARTNLLPSSVDFAGWEVSYGKTNSSLTSGATVSPAGTQDGYLVDGEMHFLYARPAGYGAAYPFNFSVYVKQHPSGPAKFNMALTASGGDSSLSLDFATRSVTATGQTPQNPGVEVLRDGWFRVWLTITPDSTYWRPVIGVGSGNLGNQFYVWGPQVETGRYPTSYIPTSGTPMTRARESLTVAASRFLAGAPALSSGTIYVDFAATRVGAQSVFSLDDTTAGEAVRLVATDGSLKFEVVDATAAQASLALGALPSAGRSKVAAAFATNDIAASLDGLSPDGDPSRFTAPSATLPSVTRLSLGGARTHLARLVYWPVRLPNDRLQALTRP